MRKPFQSKLNNLKIFLCLPAARVESLQINLFNFGAYIRYLKFVNNNNNKNEKPKLNYTTIFQRQTGIASLVGMTKIYDLKLIPSRTNTTEITNHTRVDYIVMNQGAVEMLMGLITFSDVTNVLPRYDLFHNFDLILYRKSFFKSRFYSNIQCL